MQHSLRCYANTYQALDADSMDMEIDLSNLGTVNTMFAALFRCAFYCMTICFQNYFALFLILFCYSKLGVPIKTTISANVLEEALNGTVTVRPLPIGSSVSGKVLTFIMMDEANSLLGGVFVPLMSQFVAGREAMCSFLWCDNK